MKELLFIPILIPTTVEAIALGYVRSTAVTIGAAQSKAGIRLRQHGGTGNQFCTPYIGF